MLPFQATSRHQLNLQEITIKKSSYPSPELMHINFVSSQIQLEHTKQYIHKLLTDFVIYFIPLIRT